MKLNREIYDLVKTVFLDSKTTSWRWRKDVCLLFIVTSICNGEVELEIERFMKLNYKLSYKL